MVFSTQELERESVELTDPREPPPGGTPPAGWQRPAWTAAAS